MRQPLPLLATAAATLLMLAGGCISSPNRPDTPYIDESDYKPQGVVSSVNAEMKYALINFSGSRAPQALDRMKVWRDGEEVGEIVINGPAKPPLFAADIEKGSLRRGDLVRP